MDEKNKSICFVLPTLGAGGQERVVSLLANFLVENYFKVQIITLFKCPIAYSTNKKINIEPLIENYKSNVYYKLKTITLLIFRIRALKPDVVISFGEVFNPLSIIACKVNRVPIIVSDRSNPLLEQTKFRKIIKKITYPFAASIIAQTKKAKQVFTIKKYNKKIHILPNPLKLIDNHNYNHEKKAIIHVGSLKREKNQDDLIRVFKEINDENWQVYLVGEGRRRYELTKLIDELNLNEQVHLIGQVEDVDVWLNKGSIFVFPSLYEGFPNALNEAMAFPLACIGYDCPTGVSELIEDGFNGYLVPLGDTIILKNRLKMLMNDQDLRQAFMKKSIKNRELYSIEKIGAKFIRIISNYI